MSEKHQCSFCGRFLRQNWFLSSDEPDSWQDSWSCGQDEKHRKEHPWAYGLESHDAPMTGENR